MYNCTVSFNGRYFLCFLQLFLLHKLFLFLAYLYIDIYSYIYRQYLQNCISLEEIASIIEARLDWCCIVRAKNT